MESKETRQLIKDSFKLLAACVLLGWAIFSGEIKADNIYIHTVSYHENREANYNEANHGLGIRHYIDSGEYIAAGTYRNSEYNQSNYIGHGKEFGGDLKIGFQVGFITGYSVGKVLPYILPTLRYKAFSIVYAPAIEPVIHLTIDLL